jgi:hypothetical protein
VFEIGIHFGGVPVVRCGAISRRVRMIILHT